MKMEDIAKLAGVSKSAVSLAFSGKQGIGAETRDKILRIAKENGYLPKFRAVPADGPMKSLTFLAFANSGIVLEQYYQQPFFRELIHYIEERCRTKGYSLIFSSIEMDSFAKEIKTVAEENGSAGIILLGTNLNQAQIAAVADDLSAPLVVLDTCYETLPVHFVSINNVMGAYQVGSHLCGIGHREIGYIASDVRIRNFDDRKRGFKEALREYGLDVKEERMFSVAPTILTSQEALKRQLAAYLEAGRQLPTAFFCECDYIAISAIKTLSELGYRIPDDVSVVGFDNISEAVIVTPELTTVHVDKERMAHLAVDLVLQTIESNESAKTKTIVDTQLKQRQSTRPPAE
ncbi:LacI family DNA-binding transcriptional regulator [Paenibacillus solisilvae]|uniref:LacI family DNA-binding transcriptional regulator n=1 Tax=Paenibacillus solisilvae TaxID=2486751 RepID=A0ABW0VWB1_9BACL